TTAYTASARGDLAHLTTTAARTLP
nr:Chain 5, PROTEIN (GH-LOOP FROM VIRUS CAPSID PROTEIN VP1) [Foot and mouth disease virus C]